MKNSRQRNCIYEALKNTTSHPTAEELLTMVKPIMPSINIATVYRNLKIMLADGKAINICAGADGKDRFDANVSPHAHLKCTRCNRLIDIMFSDSQLNGLREISDGAIELSYVGLCNECKKEIN